MLIIRLIILLLIPISLSGLVWSDNFASGNIEDWQIVDNDNNHLSWTLCHVPDIAFSGEYAIGCGFDSQVNDDWLISPLLTISEDEFLSFSLLNPDYDSSHELVEVLISPTGSNTLSAFTYLLTSLDISADDAWQNFSYSLAEFSTGSIRFAFRSISTAGDVIWADSFRIAPFSPPLLAVSCERLEFPATRINQLSDLSFQITNEGSGNLSGSLHLSPPFFSAHDFDSSSRVILVSFEPTSLGVFYQELIINSSGGTISIPLSGSAGFYIEDFQNVLGNEWIVIDNDDNANSWQHTLFSGRHNTPAYQVFHNEVGSGDDWLISPPILANSFGELSFFAKGITSSIEPVFDLYISPQAGSLPASFTTLLATQSLADTLFHSFQYRIGREFGEYYRFAICTSLSGGQKIIIDDMVLPGQITTATNDITATPKLIHSVFPSPFSYRTTPIINFKYSRHVQEFSKISIFNIKGQKIFQTANLPASNIFSWSPHDNYGQRLASGIYFYQITSQSTKQSGKFIIIK